MRGLARRRSLALSCALSMGAAEAHAFEAYVDADLNAQLYELQNPWRTVRLERRRFTHTLAIRGMNLTGAGEPDAPHLDAVVRARLDADVAIAQAQTDPATRSYIPGLREAPMDLMVAYMEGRGFLGGPLGFRIGRQYVVDSLGWWSFDGAQARIEIPAHVALEIYGGAEQRGGPPMLSTSRYEADGVLRGDRTGLEATEWPEYLDGDRIAPAVGAAIEAHGLSFLQARATYRKVLNRDDAITSPFPDETGALTRFSGMRTSTERAGVAATLSGDDLGSVDLLGVYDLHVATASEHGVGVAWYATRTLTLSGRYRYYLPTYDADSIFNWFSRHGTTHAEARGSWSPGRRWDLALALGARRFSVDADDVSEGQAADVVNATGSVEVVRRHVDGRIHGRFVGEGPEVARVLGGEVGAEQAFEDGRYDVRLLASLFDWHDETRSGADTTSIAYVVGAGARMARRARAGIELEHAMSRPVGHRIRLLGTVELTFQ